MNLPDPKRAHAPAPQPSIDEIKIRLFNEGLNGPAFQHRASALMDAAGFVRVTPMCTCSDVPTSDHKFYCGMGHRRAA